jgi:hypothetical protein
MRETDTAWYDMDKNVSVSIFFKLTFQHKLINFQFRYNMYILIVPEIRVK